MMVTHIMPRSLKRNAIIAAALAALFYWIFMLVKHAPGLRDIIPFGDDPYDAVGSFCVIAGIILALISLLRAFRSYRESGPSTEQRIYVVRIQEAVVMTVFITLIADMVAMARHPAMWMHSPSCFHLMALVSALGLAAAVSQVIILQTRIGLDAPRNLKLAALALLGPIAILAIYPERMINHIITHLLTILIADALLFASVRLLVVAFVPDNGSLQPEAMDISPSAKAWSIAAVIGFLIGALLFLAEASEGTGVPAGRLILVGSVFIGLGLAGLLIAYAFLGSPLGLVARNESN